MSVRNALNRLGYECLVTDDPDTIREADKIILPGVGEASSAMRQLRERNLDSVIIKLAQPVLGICLGLQLMCRFSDEGMTDGLGIFNTSAHKFPPRNLVPHMGWNNIYDVEGPLLSGLRQEEDMYFVHSYYAELCLETTAKTDYILPFSSALQKDNFYAVQFHPEKSGEAGSTVLKNFIEL